MYEDFIAQRLTELRMQKDVSQREMSLSIGQSKGYITQIESGHSLPSMSAFFFICEYLNISPCNFFDEDVKHPEIYGELTKNLKSLDIEQLVNINGLVKGLLK